MAAHVFSTPETIPAVLVVEDQDVCRRALTLLLRLNGYHTIAAGSAEEALQMFRKKKWPAITLVDLDLPGMSGLDLICRLRQSNANVYAVLLTAVDLDRVHAIDGSDKVEYMQKPVDFGRLLVMLETHLRGNPLAI